MLMTKKKMLVFYEKKHERVLFQFYKQKMKKPRENYFKSVKLFVIICWIKLIKVFENKEF